jgi:hypothetical protein
MIKSTINLIVLVLFYSCITYPIDKQDFYNQVKLSKIVYIPNKLKSHDSLMFFSIYNITITDKNKQLKFNSNELTARFYFQNKEKISIPLTKITVFQNYFLFLPIDDKDTVVMRIDTNKITHIKLYEDWDFKIFD